MWSFNLPQTHRPKPLENRALLGGSKGMRHGCSVGCGEMPARKDRKQWTGFFLLLSREQHLCGFDLTNRDLNPTPTVCQALCQYIPHTCYNTHLYLQAYAKVKEVS